MVKSLPGVTPKPRFGLNLDSTDTTQIHTGTHTPRTHTHSTMSDMVSDDTGETADLYRPSQVNTHTVEDKRPLCQLVSKRTLRQSGERLPESRCFVEDKRPLCQLSSKRLEEKWHTWYSTALSLYTHNKQTHTGTHTHTPRTHAHIKKRATPGPVQTISSQYTRSRHTHTDTHTPRTHTHILNNERRAWVNPKAMRVYSHLLVERPSEERGGLWEIVCVYVLLDWHVLTALLKNTTTAHLL